MASLAAAGLGVVAGGLIGYRLGKRPAEQVPSPDQEEDAGRAVSREMARAVAETAGLSLSEEELGMVTDGLNEGWPTTLRERFEEMRSTPIGNATPPALHFSPLVAGASLPEPGGSVLHLGERAPVSRPADLEEVAFWAVADLAHLIETRQVTPTELTAMYLRRLKRLNPALNCVVNLVEERALMQAKRADAEIAQGKYRGVLHGIPWGAKDIIAVKGYPTTWGAAVFEEQVIDSDATVVRLLDEAGAILVAKLTTGELAFGDEWFGGRTNSPW